MIIEKMVLSATREYLVVGGLKFNIWWWPFLYAFVENFFKVLTVILVVATFLVFYRFQSVRSRIYDAIGEAVESGKLSKEKIIKKWEEIEKMSESDIREDNRQAVVAAEEILDSALKFANYTGENLERRIEKVPDNQLNFKEDIIWAYRIKEKINSAPNWEVEKEEMTRAVYIFERALRELNIL